MAAFFVELKTDAAARQDLSCHRGRHLPEALKDIGEDVAHVVQVA